MMLRQKVYSTQHGLTFDNRWLNIPARTLTAPSVGSEFDVCSEEEGIQQITNAIETLNVQAIGGQVLGYLNAGYSSETPASCSR